MRRSLALASCALIPLLLPAQPDPLASSECQAARAELEAASEAVGNAGTQPRERLARAQQSARSACLGHNPGVRERSGAPEPAIAVPPVAVVPHNAPSPPALPAAAAPVVIPRPTVINTCDAAGCWDSEGRRLNSAGPALMAPRGLCSGSGSVINCP